MEISFIGLERSTEINNLLLATEGFLFRLCRLYKIKYPKVRKVNIWLTKSDGAKTKAALTKEDVSKAISNISWDYPKYYFDNTEMFREQLLEIVSECLSEMDNVIGCQNTIIFKEALNETNVGNGCFELVIKKKRGRSNQVKLVEIIAQYKKSTIAYYLKFAHLDNSTDYSKVHIFEGDAYDVFIGNVLHSIEFSENIITIKSLLGEFIFELDLDTMKTSTMLKSVIPDRPVWFLEKMLQSILSANSIEPFDAVRYRIFWGVPGGVKDFERLSK